MLRVLKDRYIVFMCVSGQRLTVQRLGARVDRFVSFALAPARFALACYGGPARVSKRSEKKL